MNTLSTRTIGYLLAFAERGPSVMTKANVRDLLMRAGIYDLSGFDTDDLIPRGTQDPPAVDILRPPLLKARTLAVEGDQRAHEALLELVRLFAEKVSAIFHANNTLRGLQAALISDGYEIQWGPSNLMPGQSVGRPAQVRPIDPEAVPLEPELSALEAELDSRGYTVALHHYQAAIKHFHEQDHTSANGQIRNMVEALVVRLAVDHTGYSDNGMAGQGGRAIQTLYDTTAAAPRVVGQPLPEADGGRMLHGIWQVLHPSGPHPGLSDAEEARFRMQLCTALARFLLKHFPAKS